MPLPKSLLLLACFVPMAAVAADPADSPGVECVPVARAMSGIRLYGDAATWWDQAEGRYQRGSKPQVGAVLAFKPIERMPLGHVAVVSRIVEPRIIMVTHSNWSTINGKRGFVERDVTVVDTSPRNDWSSVRVWYATNQGLGGTTYPVRGFIYGALDAKAPAGVRPGVPAADLSGASPDVIGAVIDSLG